MGRAIGTLIAAVAGVALVTGCSSGDGTSASSSGTAASGTAVSSPARPSGGAGQSAAPSSVAAAGPTAGGPAGSFAANGSCALQHRENLILWEQRPDQPPTATTVSDVDYATCQYAKDSLALTEPTDPGYCDILARPSDNPGYDLKATSPPKPPHILAKAGNGC